MATWDEEDHGEWTCGKCGRVYRVRSKRYPSKDLNKERCECGNAIALGNSTYDYWATFVRQGDPKDAARNPKLP